MYGVISKLSLWLLAAYDPTARRGRERQVLRQFQCIPTEEKGRAGDSGKQSLPTMKVSQGYFYLARRRTELSQKGMAVAGAA